jgi:hypothetical protein
LGDLAAEVFNRSHAEPGNLYATTHMPDGGNAQKLPMSQIYLI